jgi:hypothetical protein
MSGLSVTTHGSLIQAAVPVRFPGVVLGGQPVLDLVGGDVQEPARLDQCVGAIGLEMLDHRLPADGDPTDLGDARAA